MTSTTMPHGRPINPVFISTYPPMRCGIATFTHALVRAVGEQIGRDAVAVAAIGDERSRRHFPPEVIRTCVRDSRQCYGELASFINGAPYDVVCLQHEFGIFGGDEGSYILDTLRALHKPVVATLHTILADPAPHYHRRLREVIDACDAVVVLTPHATRILADVYDVKQEKIRLIPHGIPDVSFEDPEPFARKIGAEGRLVIMTFGLIGPSKGIEEMIEAMPAVVQRHPEVLYMIVGETHPAIVASQGQAYRDTLTEKVARLGLSNHIVFHNRFLSDSELHKYLNACTIYVTPYPNRDQISSGTLTYAAGMGKAVVSTPYWHAQDLLANGRGAFADFRSPASFAAAINDLIENREKREEMRRRAFQFGRRMRWSNVASNYLELFAEVSAERSPMNVSMASLHNSVTVGSLTDRVPRLGSGHH
ncbi:MAG TPA: glycosyltransferase family 4 protein [Candidatus Kapabacteria bacterium]|nr:glycosyltransferase family 4 protein [Candidatus Kapabacteria bacterium]